MRRCVAVALAVAVLVAARPATAAIISFQNPDLALGDCSFRPSPPIASRPLRVYEEAGVRLLVFTSYPLGTNNATVDCSNPTPFPGIGLLGPVVAGPQQYPPLLMFAQDSDAITVMSLSGAAIRRIQLDVEDRFPGPCDPLVFSLGFSICDFSGDLNFADYGFPNGVTSFRMAYLTDNVDGVAIIRQIEVPEPVGGALLALGLAAAVRRWRRA
jgi:hypothetical protein